MHRIGSVTVGAMAQSGERTDWRLIYVSDPSSMTNYDFDPAYEEFSSLTAGSSCRFYPGVTVIPA